MFDIIIEFFKSEAVKNHWVLLVVLLVLSFALGCFITSIVMRTLYIPYKKNKYKEFKEQISKLDQEISKSQADVDTYKGEYEKIRKHNEKVTVEVDFEDYQSGSSPDAALSEFVKK